MSWEKQERLGSSGMAGEDWREAGRRWKDRDGRGWAGTGENGSERK